MMSVSREGSDMRGHGSLVLVTLLGACASTQPVPGPRHVTGTAPLAPFDVDLPPDNTRHQLAVALRDRGFLPADAPPETQLGGAIRAFQKSRGLEETGWPDDATLRALGIDPSTKDRSLDTATVHGGPASAAGVGGR